MTVASLKRAGAVGDILGQFVDADGPLADHPLNQRAISPSLDVLARISPVIVASGGRNKAPVLAGVFRARLATSLACDEKTAEAMLRLWDKRT